MTHQQKMVIVTAVLLVKFLGALEQTIVSAAAPSIVVDLQGMERFTRLATSYLMASTALVPIYGKLADLYSRKIGSNRFAEYIFIRLLSLWAGRAIQTNYVLLL
jgi:MFS family permease